MFYSLFSKIVSYLRPRKNNFCAIFDHVYVINLKRCLDRKAHTAREFARVGIEQYEFIKAIDKDDPEVLQWIQSGKVAQFPSCFRCGKNRCDCANNILIPQHIGNWCSFIKVFKDILEKQYNFCLICEDDLEFTPHFNTSIAKLFTEKSYKQHHIDKKNLY